MRFLVDMGIALTVVETLRQQHDAVHLRDEGLQRLPDEKVLAKAVAENRIVLTHDLDMSRLIALSGAKTPSLITFRLNDMRPVSVLPRLLECLGAFGPELEAGAAVTVTDRAIRCHRLPMSEG